MLNVGISMEIIRRFIKIIALHDIVQEVLDQFTIFFRLIQIGKFHCSIDLGMTGGVWFSCKHRQIIPVLSNLSVIVEAENIEHNLFTSTRCV